MKLNNITQKEFDEVVKNHLLWIRRKDGECANLPNTDFSDISIKKVNLDYANLLNCNFINVSSLMDTSFVGANLPYSRFDHTQLIGLNFDDANCSRCSFYNVSMRNVSFIGANLGFSDFHDSIINKCHFRRSNLTYADFNDLFDLDKCDFIGSNTSDAMFDGSSSKNIDFSLLVPPEKGSFIGFKKAFSFKDSIDLYAEPVVVELKIPSDAKRSSSTTRKCRASKAIPKAFYKQENHTWKRNDDLRVSSGFKMDFFYKIGEEAISNNFDENRWNECSGGIHFFMTFEEAAKW